MKPITFIRANKTKHGGAEVYLSRLSEALREKGITHRVVHSKIPKWLPSWVRVLCFNADVCRQKSDDELYFSLERISCADIYRAGDGVHRVFVDVEQKSMLNPLHTVYMMLEKRCFNNAKRIIANSKMIKRQIIETYDIDAQKVAVVYNGIKLETVDREAAKERLMQEFMWEENDMLFLYVGSGFKRKGVREFLQILSKLKRKCFRAFVVGKEKQMDEYRALAKALGLSEKVYFTGARDDVKDFYAISDIFLFPTHYEPFSNVVLEAMWFENAVFTTRQNGASEILDKACIMENPNDTAVVKKIEALFADPEKLAKMKADNKAQAGCFSIEKNVEETLKVMDEAVR